jgi:hypothetical protein
MTLEEIQKLWGESTCGKSIEQFTFDILNSEITRLENLNKISKFSNSEIGSHHWSATVLSFIMRVGEYMAQEDKDLDIKYYRDWGIQIKERAIEVNNFIHTLPDKP